MVSGRVTAEPINPNVIYHFRPHQMKLQDLDFNHNIQLVSNYGMMVKHDETETILDSGQQFDVNRNHWATPEPIHLNLALFRSVSNLSCQSRTSSTRQFCFGLLFLELLILTGTVIGAKLY